MITDLDWNANLNNKLSFRFTKTHTKDSNFPSSSTNPLNVDNIYPLSDTDGVYTKGAGHLNTSDKADEYIYNSQDNNYIVSVKNGLAQQLDGIDGANMTYIIDSKNDYIYWVGNKKVS